TPPSLPQSIAGVAAKPGLTTRLESEDEDGDEADDEDHLSLSAVSVSSGGTIPLGADGKGFTLDINRLDFQANKEEFERQFLISALKAFKGRINQTALHANIPKKTLLRKLQKYQISARDYA